jgi:hypothetical protein
MLDSVQFVRTRLDRESFAVIVAVSQLGLSALQNPSEVIELDLCHRDSPILSDLAVSSCFWTD